MLKNYTEQISQENIYFGNEINIAFDKIWNELSDFRANVND